LCPHFCLVCWWAFRYFGVRSGRSVSTVLRALLPTSSMLHIPFPWGGKSSGGQSMFLAVALCIFDLVKRSIGSNAGLSHILTAILGLR